jgi:hypothetical protein
MTHLHGGFVRADSDGNPAVTTGFPPGGVQTVHYTNQLPQMPASLLWFHSLRWLASLCCPRLLRAATRRAEARKGPGCGELVSAFSVAASQERAVISVGKTR